MRIALTALTPQGPQDVMVTGDDGVPVGQVAAVLRAATRGASRLARVIALPGAAGLAPGGAQAGAGQETLWMDGRALDPGAPAAAMLRDGALVALDPQTAAGTSLAEPSGLIEVRVVGGPAAGTVHRLGLGTVILGASPDCGVRLAGVGLPAYAARLSVGPGGPAGQAIVEPLAGGGNGPVPGAGAPVLLDGEPLTGPQPWLPGIPLQIGSQVLTLARPEPPDAHVSPSGDGGLAYNRPPRLPPSGRPRRIEMPAEPKRADRPRLQLLAALLPLIFGLVMIKVMHSAVYALFMLMSPVMVVGTWLSERRHGRVDYKRRMKEYRAAMSGLDSVIATERAADEAQRREAAPDPAQILLTATGPRRRLWERRGDDPDALHLRIGLADLPANLEFVAERGGTSDADLPPVPAARTVPVSLPLPSLGVVGLAGQPDTTRGLARWLVAQAAALHSPRDLRIVVLAADPAAGPHWNWVRWLPHCAPQGGEDCLALVGTDAETAARRIAELSGQAAERMAAAGQAGGFGMLDDGPPPGPKTLVVLDGARVLRRVSGMPGVLAAARKAGIYAICLDEAERMLPEECAAVLSWDPAEPGRVTVRGSGFDVLGPVLADHVGAAWADRVARAMAPLRDVSREDADAAIPSSARLLDLVRLPEPAADDICGIWDRLGRTTEALIGVGGDGPASIDLRADGPHGLVAGTTGSGKSELLQTIIASLAVVNRPDSMNFVLIDYKGGSAFKDCARLPHTVGMVSDLDGHLTERALASLAAELKRREEVLLAAGAKDIEDYWDTRRTQPDLPPLSRLVLIIDEFASLVAELPDFVTGLVGIAQRGRSLGVHLLLATQRPAGVVSADIRANTNLRIALRVTDPDESADVIDTRDAAAIAKSAPGRCYVRSGAGTPVAVQSARIGGRRPGAGPAEAAAHAVLMPWTGLGRPLPASGPLLAEDDPDLATDLSVLVDAVAGAAVKLGIPAQRSPWLAPLPGIVTLDELPGDTADGAAGETGPIPFGLTDQPARQAREPLGLDLAHGGHLVVAGAARTGRSTMLRTIAGSVAARTSPADVHIYALDCGTGALLPLSGLPHCGAVVTRDQTDRVERLIRKLRDEITRRQQLLAADGFAGLAEQRASAAPGDRLPWMLLLMDWWEGYVAAYEHYDYGRQIDALLQTFREGAAVGLRAVVTTDRSALLGQAGAVFGQRMLLRLTDKGDAGLAGINERSLPTDQPPGRVMFDATPDALEAQIALLSPDPSGPAQVAALRQLGTEAAARHGRPPAGQRPLRVDPLPARLTAEEARQLSRGWEPPSPLWALAGAGGDELAPVGLDVRDDGPGLVVAGPPRSGRSTTLLTMARSLLASGTPVVALTPRRSPLRSLADADGVLAVLGPEAGTDDLTKAIGDRDCYVVLADDAELLVNGPLSDPLEKIVRTGRDGDHGLILAGSTPDFTRAYSGFVPAALKSRAGILVAIETPNDGDLFNIRLPRNAGPGPLGRGLLIRPGRVLPVQLAVTE
ncbi:MAG: cell division protein FtsK [Nocardiopsaceae bacterium]|jgi:S-DNA-T family DNA segregation ATPase FtsK/SpoIIIE|nr:cell division protein FtsK [Nocardiopsaceae bacterium]